MSLRLIPFVSLRYLYIRGMLIKNNELKRIKERAKPELKVMKKLINRPIVTPEAATNDFIPVPVPRASVGTISRDTILINILKPQ